MPRRKPRKRAMLQRLEHTCTLQKLTRGDGSGSASGGHGGAWDVDYAEAVPCLLMPRKGVKEVETSAGVVLLTHMVVLEYRTDLMADKGAATYRVTNVQDAGETVLDIGPLNILFVKDPGGRHHHLELDVTRQRIGV